MLGVSQAKQVRVLLRRNWGAMGQPDCRELSWREAQGEGGWRVGPG